MAHVVDYSEFESLVQRMERMEAEIKFLKGLLTGQQWLSRNQTLLALGCSETTLWKLTKGGWLTYRREGRKIQYQIDSLRFYLRSKQIEAYRIDERLLEAYHTKD